MNCGIIYYKLPIAYEEVSKANTPESVFVVLDRSQYSPMPERSEGRISSVSLASDGLGWLLRGEDVALHIFG